MFRLAFRQLFLASLLVFGATLCACQASAPPAQPTGVQPMPPGYSFNGVYRGRPQGQLHLVEDEGKVAGAWRTSRGDAFGELKGEVRGNLLTFEWWDEKTEAAGGGTRFGRGYFVYQPGTDGKPDEIVGQWGLGDQASGQAWRARRWHDVSPNLWNVRPGGVYGGEDEDDSEFDDVEE